MPKRYQPLIQSDAALKLARRALGIKWFSSVGTASEELPDVRWVHDWDMAVASLQKPAWDDYLLDARNAMADPVPRPQINDWRWVIDVVDGVLSLSVLEAVRGSLSVTGPLSAKVTDMVLMMVRLSCVEAHFAQWVKVRFFGEMFHWLEVGRLPCGAVGEFPARPILVF
jgi:hypothetical protein